MNDTPTDFRNKLDMSQIIFRQLDRTNLMASLNYETAVIQKLNNLPIEWQNWVTLQSGRYSEEILKYKFKAPCGIKVGSRNDPVVWNEKHDELGRASAKGFTVNRWEDGSIDWSDPQIHSPHLETEEYVDYTKMDGIIMEALEYAKLTWIIDPLEQDAGLTEEYIVERKKTPFRKPRIPDTEG